MVNALWVAYSLLKLLAYHVIRLSGNDSEVTAEINDALADLEEAIVGFEGH
jgi:hypothetical protein